jgi:MORN repeat protein
MLSFSNPRISSLLLNYFVIVMVPLFAWGQDSPSREQAINITAMHVQKNTERFPDGKPKKEYYFYRGKDGLEVLHGKYITWFESGQKFSEQNYRNGKVEGRTVYWHENGKKSWQGTYHDDYPVGRWVSWRKNGQKESSCSYVNGEKEGVCLWWDDRGRKADSVEYTHGKPRAIAEWEARDQRTVKTPIYLYPSILVHPDGSLTFTSAYTGITKDFSLAQVEGIFASLPASVWVDGKSIGVQQIGLASEADQQTMAQITEKVKAFFTSKGYRVYRLPQ